MRVCARCSKRWRCARPTGPQPMTQIGPSFGRRDPDARGYYGAFGGRFVPETLVAPVQELERAYLAARDDPELPRANSCSCFATTSAGRRRSTRRRRLSGSLGGARIFLKREDLAHTGAHKINNALGQALLAKRMGKRRVVAETGAGQHGVASATVCALLGLRMSRLHGRRGHAAAVAERVPDATAGSIGESASTAAAARSRTRSTKRCATGSRTSTTATTCSGRSSVRTRIH